MERIVGKRVEENAETDVETDIETERVYVETTKESAVEDKRN